MGLKVGLKAKNNNELELISWKNFKQKLQDLQNKVFHSHIMDLVCYPLMVVEFQTLKKLKKITYKFRTSIKKYNNIDNYYSYENYVVYSIRIRWEFTV